MNSDTQSLSIDEVGHGRPMARFTYADNDVWRDFLSLRFAIATKDGLFEANPPTFRKREEYCLTPTPPMLSLLVKGEGNLILTSMMDQLWNMGVRPSDIGTPGHLAATQAHLKDLQELHAADITLQGRLLQDLEKVIFEKKEDNNSETETLKELNHRVEELTKKLNDNRETIELICAQRDRLVAANTGLLGQVDGLRNGIAMIAVAAGEEETTSMQRLAQIIEEKIPREVAPTGPILHEGR